MDKVNQQQDNKKVFISTKIKKVNAWTKEEDEVLLSQAEKHGYRHWKKIAAALQNRSSIQCSARYKRIRPGLVKGNWAKEEDDMVLELVGKFGKNWSLISKYLPSRTGKQIRDRFLNTLDSNINRDKFSSEEDQKIIELYLQHGTKWSNIAKFFEKRTGDMIKNRFYSTLRKKVHGYVRFKKSANRKIRRLRRIRSRNSSRNSTKNLFHIDNCVEKQENLHIKEDEVGKKDDHEIKDLKKGLLHIPNNLQKAKQIDDIPLNEEETISKLNTDSSIYPKTNNNAVLGENNTSFVPYNKAKTAEDLPLRIPTFPAYNVLENRPNSNTNGPNSGIYNLPNGPVNVNDYVMKIKQIETSMNQSLMNYLNFSSQYQMMNTLYSFYINQSNHNQSNNNNDKNI